MTTIALHNYHKQIDQLLNDNQYDLAVEHCRHILQQQPQHIATYRLLAKALLEKGDYDGATELFQRVLSAAPNDYIAHAGLSVIFKEEDVLSQAIWHLERAYEIEPYNAAIQQELRSLYVHQFDRSRKTQQNGDTAVVPTVLLLTEGALARLYLRSELYDQATAVLRAGLSKDEERIDLRALLMEALWRDGRRMEAVTVALQVLNQLPNCITANAILAEIWLRTGRVDEAQSYLHRLHSLLLFDNEHFDSESPEGIAFSAEGAIALPAVIELDYLGSGGDRAEFEEAGRWAPTAVAVERSEVETDDDMYQWLEGLTGEPPADQPAKAAAAWTDEDPSLADDTQIASTAVPQHQSDWLAGLSSPAEEETPNYNLTAAAVQSKKDRDAEFAGLFSDEEAETGLDWLAGQDLDLSPQAAKVTTGQTKQPDEFAPDWLTDMDQDDLEPMQIDALTAANWLRETDQGNDAVDDDAFDWLEITSDDARQQPTGSEAGEIDLSQFGEIPLVEDEEKEIEWRLTDELSSPDTPVDTMPELSPMALDDLEDLGFATPGELPADIPDWLMGGSETGDLYEEAQPAKDELAQELADWVAANSPDLPESEDALAWLQDDEEDDDGYWGDEASADDESAEELDALDLAIAAMALNEQEPDLPDSGALPDWLSGAAPATVDSQLLGTDNLAPKADLFGEESVDDETFDWLQEKNTAVPEKTSGTGDLPDWLMGAGLDSFDSAPLDEKKVADSAAFEPEIDFQVEPTDTPDAEIEAPVMSSMMRAAVEMDFSTEDSLRPVEGLPDWLMGDGLGDEIADGSAEASLDVEEVVSDDKDEKMTGPTEEPKTPAAQPVEPDEDLDWLNDLDALSEAESTGVEALHDTGELPEWMAMDLTVLAEGVEQGEIWDTAVSPNDIVKEPAEVVAAAIVPLEEDPELDWLDALATAETESEPLDELPTWQWPDAPVEKRLAAEDVPEDTLDTLINLGDVVAAPDQEPDLLPGDLDDAMSWLEELAGEPGAPIEELPTIAQSMDVEDLLAFPSASDRLPEDFPAEEEFDMPPEDPDAAMAWLERLAARQGAPLDELPSVMEAPEPEVSELDELDFSLPAATLVAAAVADSLADDADDEATAELAASSADDWMTGELAEDLSLTVPEDPEAAMAWLERLAARQGAPLDELPSITDDTWLDDSFADEPRPEPFDAELEELDLEELDLDLFGAPAELETAVVLDEPAGAPDDLDEAMAWLEGLAARQGAPLDELPSIKQPLEVEEPELDLFADDFADEAAPGALDDLTEAMSWLEGLGEEEGTEELDTAVPDWLIAEAEADIAIERRPIVAPALLAELAWLEDEADLEPQSAITSDFDLDEADISEEELAAALDQLDELARLPVASSVGKVEPPLFLADDLGDFPDELDDWFGEAAADEPREADELDVAATIITAVASPEAIEPDEIIAGEADFDNTFLEAIPDDPDEAMAWLERLAARQGASLDELPSLYDADEETLAALTAVPAAPVAEQPEPVETAVSDLAVPENIEDAMAWLEQLAARQGASLDELPTVQGEVGDFATPAWIVAAQAAAAAETVQPEAAGDDQAGKEDSAVGDDMFELAAAEWDTAVNLSEPVDAAVPDNIEDAMAWLERLAARQGASLDELPTVTEATLDDDDDLAMPDWIAAAQASAIKEEGAAEVTAVTDEADEWEDILFAADEPDEEPLTGYVPDEQDDDLDDVDDSLPDWLTTEGEERQPRVVGHTDWLGTLPEPDLDGWLAAEEEATIGRTGALDFEPPAPARSGKTGPLSSKIQTGPLSPKIQTGPLSELSLPEDMDFEDDLMVPDLDLGLSAVELDENRLQSVREALGGGEVESAMQGYAVLIEKGEGLNTLIADLEVAANRHAGQPLVRRMLGDAYMRNGQLQKALETYRQALDRL